MLHENLKILRSRSGMSQEMVAQRLHVVRQTVSKWEKGISVPDADMLRKIADVFEVSVSELLGEVEPRNFNEIAVPLALLKEQLANRSRRIRAFWKGCLILGVTALVVWSCLLYGKMTAAPDLTERIFRLTCTLDGQTYHYSVSCDKNMQVVGYGGDTWVHETIVEGAVQFTGGGIDGRSLIGLIEESFRRRGGTVEVEEIDPDVKPAPTWFPYAGSR